MPQKTQSEDEQFKVLQRRLADPFPKEFMIDHGGDCGIVLDADDEKILDEAWESERKRLDTLKGLTNKL